MIDFLQYGKINLGISLEMTLFLYLQYQENHKQKESQKWIQDHLALKN